MLLRDSRLVAAMLLPLREGTFRLEVAIGKLKDGTRFTREAVLEPEKKEVVVPRELAG